MPKCANCEKRLYYEREVNLVFDYVYCGNCYLTAQTILHRWNEHEFTLNYHEEVVLTPKGVKQ